MEGLQCMSICWRRGLGISYEQGLFQPGTTNASVGDFNLIQMLLLGKEKDVQIYHL